MSNIKGRLSRLEAVVSPEKIIFFNTVDFAPVDRLDLIWWGEPFIREDGESEQGFKDRCEQWAKDNYSKGDGIPALFLQYPHF